MRRASLACTALLALACARPLDVPAAPGDEGTPVVLEVFPDIAVGALGSPVLVRGHRLLDADTVEVGPVRFSKARGEFTARRKGAGTDELLLHVTRRKLIAAKLLDADGERYPVRVTVGDDVADSLDSIRIYARRPSVTEISPNDLAPGTLFAINGRGFDGDDLSMNDVAFPPVPSAECWSGRNRTGKCLHAEMFWAARGIVMAVTPKDLPSGPVRLVYRNQQFEKLVIAAEAWAREGRPLSEFFVEVEADAGLSAEAAANPTVENVCEWATSSDVASSIGDIAIVWEDPGVITVDPRVLGTMTIRAAGQLCYPLLVATKRLEVFVDGAPIAPAAIACAGDKGLKLELPAAVLARPAIPHAVQVQNPRFTSPVAFFTLN